MSRLTKLLKPHAVLSICTILLCINGCGGTGTDLPQLTQQTASSEASTNPTTNGSDPTGSNNSSSGTSTGTNSSQTQKTAVLSWLAPTTNVDGTPLADLAGFRVYYGQTALISKETSQQVAVGDTLTYTVSGLQNGLYYFAVVAVDLVGNESGLSQTMSKNIL